MSQVDLVYNMLVTDLEAPRVLLGQVLNYIEQHYSYTPAQFEQFTLEKMPTLEEYEMDLIFSPQYTPAEHNRLEYIPLLGDKALSPADVTMLKRRLADLGMTTRMTLPDGESSVSVPVYEVFIERYVSLLKLDQPLPTVLHDAIMQYVPADSRNELNLLAREDAWKSESRQDILLAFLRVFQHNNSFSTLKASYLTNFVRTYRPSSLLDIERQLDSLIRSCQTDMERVSGRGFQDEYLRSLHGRSPQNVTDEKNVWAHYKHMMEMAEALKEDFRSIPEIAPDLMERARRQPV